MRWAILDSDIYIGHWQRGAFEDLLVNVRKAFVVRHSAVVLAELRRGARTREAERLVNRLHHLAGDFWEPTRDDWWEAGRLVREIGDRQNWETAKRREFQNDALIALTARRHGAAVITANAKDFSLLAARLRIAVFTP